MHPAVRSMTGLATATICSDGPVVVGEASDPGAVVALEALAELDRGTLKA